VNDGVTTAPRVVSSLYVERGLTVVRYLSSPASADWPTAEVIAPSELRGKVQLVPAPGVRPGFLEGPGACCVVVAETPTVLRVSLSPARLGGSLDAVVKVETLDSGRPASVSELPERAPAAASVFTQRDSARDGRDNGATEYGPAIVAHIARRGDVQVAPGEWVAGPAAPAAIEGLELQPSDRLPQVEVQVLLFGQQRKWTNWVAPGTFVGTRGQSRPLVGIRCRLSPYERERWTLAAEANFLGAARLAREGAEIELVGPFADDPLVGFRLKIRIANESIGAAAEPSAEPRVRVFRAGSIVR